jgi:hypothetical protein
MLITKTRLQANHVHDVDNSVDFFWGGGGGRRC